MGRGLISLSIVAVTASLVAGCGSSSSSDTSDGREAGKVAAAYTAAMWRLDFHEACRLEFTNRHGSAYRGMTEADKKRECEVGWKHNHPLQLQPGLPGPGEMDTIKRVFGLSAAVLQSAEVTGDSATVVLRDPRSGQHREVRMRHEGGRWVVYEENVEDYFG